MVITEMIKQLEAVHREHGDIPMIISDRYLHYTIKWTQVNDLGHDRIPKHFCVRIEDADKYYDIPA